MGSLLTMRSVGATSQSADSASIVVTQAEKAYYQLRLERTNAKLVGVRAKRAAEAAAEEKDKAK
jgi:hypothetical protein